MPFGLSFGGRRGEPGAEPGRDRRLDDAGWHGAGSGRVAGLLTRGGATAEAVAAAEEALGVRLPASLAAFVREADAAEGWVAGEYFAMWPVASIAELNRVARVADFAPNLVAFASNGGGEGFLFDRQTGEFVNGPLIGLGYVQSTVVGSTFEEFLDWIAAANPVSGTPPVADPSKFGLVIHEVHPVLFGGSPTDRANKVVVPLAKYVEFVAFWNEQLRSMSAQ